MATLSDQTIADVKTYHGYTGIDKDSILTKILPLVVAEIIKFCRHDFESKSRASEKPFIEANRTEFFVKYSPVNLGVAPVLTEDGVTLTINTDYYIDSDTGRVWKVKNPDNIFESPDYVGFWTRNPDAVIITYTGGVDLADAQDVLTYLYETVGIRSGIKKRAFTDNEGVERVVFISSVPKEIKDILKPYRLRRITSSGN